MDHVETILEICKASHSESPLIAMQAEIDGAEAYEAICRNLGVVAMMSHDAYRRALPKLRKSHLQRLFGAWANSKGAEVEVKLPFAAGHDTILFGISGFPNAVFHGGSHEGLGPEKRGNPIWRLENILLRFSVYWLVHRTQARG